MARLDFYQPDRNFAFNSGVLARVARDGCEQPLEDDDERAPNRIVGQFGRFFLERVAAGMSVMKRGAANLANIRCSA
jgi:hypothetical protein